MMISPWNFGVHPSMARLQKEGLMDQAKEEVIREAEATLKRIHGDKPTYPQIDNYHALELAAENWLKQRDAAASGLQRRLSQDEKGVGA